jgi:hypothetical protein
MESAMETQDHAPPPTLIVLRHGDPVVDALRTAGSGPLVILRVLPPVFRSLPREPLERAARADLAKLVAGRWPVPRLVVRFGEPVEQAGIMVAEVGPGRVVGARHLARRLAGAVAVPVVGAEDAVVVRRRGPLSGALGFLRGALDHPENVKVSALRALALFDGVEAPDLRRLAALLDCAEVGQGHVLVPEGRRNDALWFLLEGSARRSIGGREVGRLRAPALVGGPSMVYNKPAIATITALEPVKALVAGRAQFRAISAIDAVALRLKAATADRLSDYLSADDRPMPSCGPNGRGVLA